MRHIKLLCIFIFFMFFILFFNYLFKNEFKEPLTNNDKIVLIGDSILNNSIYVSIGSSVGDDLKLKHGINNIIVNAKDGATIDTCYYQMGNIINSENYYLFISIGGNDILNKFENLDIDKLFEKYKKLIESIKNTYPKTKIYLLNLYFPTNEKYLKYTDTIIKWNELISSLSSKYNILKIDKLLKDDLDFTHEIEPSAIGSQKIADKILSV